MIFSAFLNYNIIMLCIEFSSLRLKRDTGGYLRSTIGERIVIGSIPHSDYREVSDPGGRTPI